MSKELLAKKSKLIEDLKASGAIKSKRVEKVFWEIPREKFVRDEDIPFAYANTPLSIGYGQTISQPFMVLYMTSLLNLLPDDVVLEIGTGSGYQSAILSKLVKEVYTVERIPELAKRASNIFKELKIENVHIKVGDGTVGWEEFAPYDKIIVTAAGPKIPEKLIKQLKTDGIMVIPVGELSYVQTLKVIEKKENGEIDIRDDIRCVFVKLIGEEGWEIDS